MIAAGKAVTSAAACTATIILLHTGFLDVECTNAAFGRAEETSRDCVASRAAVSLIPETKICICLLTVEPPYLCR